MKDFLLGILISIISFSSGQAAMLDDIKKRGYIKVGISLGGMPMGGRDRRNEPLGYDYEVAKLLTKIMGVEMRITDIYGDARVSLLVSGQIDLVIGNMTITEKRAEVIDFTDPYFKTGLRVIYQKDQNINSLEDLNGKKVVAGRGTSGATFIAKNVPDAELVYTENFAPNGVLLLKQRRVDAGIEDSSMADYVANQMNSLNIMPGVFEAGEVAMAVRKGQPEYKFYLNEFIADYIASGEYAKNIKMWWGEDIKIPELRR